MHLSFYTKYTCVAILVIGGWVAAGTLSHAQRSPEARAEYLATQGLTEEAEAIEAMLREGLREQGMGTARRRARTADFFSFVLAVSGITLDTIERLEEEGIDLARATTGRSRPLMEQALLADLVVVGTVVGVDQNSGIPDTHNYTLTVGVSDTLKGSVPGDTILIRQKQRVSPQSPDPKPEVGETFLFLASNALYRYSLHRNTAPDARPPADEMRRRYSIYRRYRIEEGRLLWKSRSREETQQALDDIRRLAEWVRSS